MKYKFIVAGGGTSGHINPAITIADSLSEFYTSKNIECEILFVGRENSLESELVAKAGYPMKYIEAKPFPMRPNKKALIAIKALRHGRKTVEQIIDDFQPNAVIGTGGYVCAPLFTAASIKKVPVIIHESNAFPGRLNRFEGRKSALVLTGFPNLESKFAGAGKVIYTGNPIRSIMFNNHYEECRERLGISLDQPLVFAMGGSLGAKTINDFIVTCASDPAFKDVKFVLGSGKQQSAKLDKDSVKIPDNLTVMEYIDNPNDYLCGADVSITRAGAVTCAEIAAIGACNVFVPYPYAAQDHQTYNATAFKECEGGILMSDSEVAEGKLLPVLKELLNNPERRKSIRQNAKTLAVNDCSDRIVTAVNQLVEDQGNGRR